MTGTYHTHNVLYGRHAEEGAVTSVLTVKKMNETQDEFRHALLV